MNNNIFPVVVLYKRKLSDAESINSLLDSDELELIKDIYVYDNTPVEFDNNEYHIKTFRGRNVIYFRDYQNSGVSKAYNCGMSKAHELGYKYALLLDQDTVFPRNAFSHYKSAMSNNPGINLIVPRLVTLGGEFCSPLRYAFHRGFITGELAAGIYSLEKYSPINSGMLLDVATALSCGGYNDGVYLDFSDFQFIERLKRVSVNFYVMPLTIQQDLSNEDENHENLLTRYAIYCDCATRCERNAYTDDLIYFMMVFIRGLKLAKRTKKIKFLKIFYQKYMRGKK